MARPEDLSGGMRRRLGVALATVALPRVLVLDEPSAGLDPEARRELWDLLLQLRKQCSVLLTTHDMEEADVLGDRVVILSRGHVVASGTPMFLKRLFGTGYHVRIAKDPTRCDLKVLLEAVRGAVPGAKLHTDTRHETVFSLGQASSATLVDLFRRLEEDRKKMGVLAMGVTLTTMEDVYLRLHRDVDVGPGSREQLDVTQDPDVRAVCAARRRDSAGTVYRARALFWKRLVYSKRIWALPLICSLLPAALLAFQFRLERHIVGLLVHDASGGSPPATLSLFLPDMYGAITNFVSFDDSSAEVARDFYLPLLESDSASAVAIWDDPVQSLLEVAEKDRAAYVKQFLVGARFFTTRTTDNSSEHIVEAWYNPEAAHARTISLNLVHTALLRYYSGGRMARISTSLRAEQWSALGVESGLDPEDIMALLVPRFVRALFLPMATCFALAGFVLFPLSERAAGFKHLQLMAGVPGHLYWGVSLVWDLGLYSATGLCCVAPLLLQTSTIEGTLTAVAGLYWAFSVVGISLAYLGSFLSQSPAVGFVVVALLFFFGGAASTLAHVLLAYMEAFGGGPARNKSSALEMTLSSLPVFTFTWGLTKVLQLNDENRLCMRLDTESLFQFCAGLNASTLAPLLRGMDYCCGGVRHNGIPRLMQPLAMHMDGVGWEICLLLVQGIIALTVLLVLDSGYPQATWGVFVRTYQPQSPAPPPEDPDVATERCRVREIISRKSSDLEGRVLVVDSLCKAYGALNAVKSLDLALRPRECFALLGVNGAGKSTTFGMLTGRLFVTRGTAYTRHAVLTDDLKKWQENIGYCPQQKGLLGRLTGREALVLFARLRGVSNQHVPQLVKSLLRVLDLEQHADRRSSSYSGGNRRKLSVGLALVGLPDVVFLDEPSAGVDVVARSKIFRSLDALRHTAGIAVLLTSHSMQECERTCDRVGILVNGELACLGSIQHLKERFGKGYSITVKLPAHRTSDASALKVTMERVFPGIQLRDCYQGLLEYQLDTCLPWSSLFQRASDVQALHQCEDFLISDTTLEQVFIRLAKRRHPPVRV
ncbi:retinal-specific phospholipid-transporting ATPase ABCA4-like [Ornithodoros turicata]|uniref:retinal-specific phospholipid-transporting ATPase ABCA4-like n=1 Tax=Ornithodoros turicata TaxID=34597 RepID=UPI00313944ED